MNKGQSYLHPIFEMAIEDTFNKFDMLMNKVLGYREFKGFCDCVGINNITYQTFVSDYLSKFESTERSGLGGEEGLTLNGFKEMFLFEFEQNRKSYGSHSKATDLMFDWLHSLGFDKELYPVRSRLFNLTIHSNEFVECKVKDAV